MNKAGQGGKGTSTVRAHSEIPERREPRGGTETSRLGRY